MTTDDTDRCVDMFGLRTAVATLYRARHHCDDLNDSAVIRRVDDAVTLLKDFAEHFRGELSAACRALLDPAADPRGRRRTAAIDRLAKITHVDDSSADALAALAPTPVRPSRPLSLFDPQPQAADA